MRSTFYNIYKRLVRAIFGKGKEIPFKIGKSFKSKTNSLYKGTFLSYVPDKYFANLQRYKNNAHAFYDEADIKKWTAGNYINNAGDLTRFYFLNFAIDQLLFENIKGDIAELGVYKGNSAFLLAKFARQKNRTLYLFDTFNGFEKNDLQGSDSEVSAMLFTDTSLSFVKKLVGDENTIYVQGYFPESLSQLANADIRYCLAHIDCDLEQPFIHSLNYFYPRLVKGGFLIMHDYNSLYWEGARNAMNNFFADKPEMIIPIPDKSGTAVIRKL